MNDIPVHTPYHPYHPRWYRPRVSTYWWLWRWAYLKFILRELSSVFVAYFVVLMLLLLRALSHGPEAYVAFQEWLKTPHIIALNGVSLVFVLFHAVTWFNLAPRAMVVRLRGERVPDLLIAGSNYVAWLVVSVAVAWLILRG
jgi:succinate dehydrogenase subunit C